MGKRLIAIVLVLLLGGPMIGCSTVSFIIDPPPKGEKLVYGEEDVLRTIKEMQEKGEASGKSGDPAVTYNKTSGKFEMSPDAYERAVRDGILAKVQEKKIKEFLAEYRRGTIKDAMLKDAGMTLFGVVLAFVALFLF